MNYSDIQDQLQFIQITLQVLNLENGDLNPNLKHISIKYHFNYDYISKNIIKLKYIETKNMLADILTKSVNGPKIKEFANRVFF